MRKTLFAIAVLFLMSTARAAVPTAASIDTLLSVTHAEAVLDTMLGNVDRMMRQSMANVTANQNVTPAQQRVIDDMRERTAQIFREEFTWAKLQPIYVQVYQESFTQDEIDGLIAFYRSPAGAAFVAKMPVVMQKSMAATQTMMGPIMQKLQAAQQQATEDLKNAH